MADSHNQGDTPNASGSATADIVIPARLLSAMCVFSVGMAAICLLAAVIWLVVYQFSLFRESHDILQNSQSTYYPDFVLKTQMQALLIQSTPISCGMLAGVGLSFLGFALFMVNVNSKINVEGTYEKAKIKFVNMSPGLLVMLVAAVLVAFCISRYHVFEPKVLEKWESAKKVPHLAEAKRRKIYYALDAAVTRAHNETEQKFPPANHAPGYWTTIDGAKELKTEEEFRNNLEAHYQHDVAIQYHLTDDQLAQINDEGIDNNWPVPE